MYSKGVNLNHQAPWQKDRMDLIDDDDCINN